MGDKKTDMDRVGLFQEMGYVTIKDPYKAAGSGMLKMLMYCMLWEMHIKILLKISLRPN